MRRLSIAFRVSSPEQTIFVLEFLREFILFKSSLEARATAWATASLAAVVYAVIVISIDRNEKEPWQMLLVGFFLGAVVSDLTFPIS